MTLQLAVQQLIAAEHHLAAAFRSVGERHAADHDVAHMTATLAEHCELHVVALQPLVQRACGEQSAGENHRRPRVLRNAMSALRRRISQRMGRSQWVAPLLVEDLRRLYVAAGDVHIRWLIVGQGAKAARDHELEQAFTTCCEETVGQIRWLTTRIKVAAPQTLTVDLEGREEPRSISLDR